MHDAELQKFCREILMALEGRVAPHWFNEGFALCTNAGGYDQANETRVYTTLSKIFDGETFPFNNGDPSNYNWERWNGGFYANEKRMAFLKKYA